MFTKRQLQIDLSNHPLVKPRLDTLKLATEINPEFRNPHIIGGFLRNIILSVDPNDCDVSFQGNIINQPRITEAVREAEKKLNLEPYPEWEFENISATGISKNFYEDNIGKYAHHTDYLTVLMMDTNGELYLGEEEKTLHDLEHRIYDFRFSGIEVWAKHRGNGRSYTSCIVGDLTRGLYLCQALNLRPSDIVTFLMNNYDNFFYQLQPDDQKARKEYWRKKTKGNIKYKEILDRFEIKTLIND